MGNDFGTCLGSFQCGAREVNSQWRAIHWPWTHHAKGPNDDSLTHVNVGPPAASCPEHPGQRCDFLGSVGKTPRPPPQPHPQQRVGGRVQRGTLQFNRVPLIFPCRTEKHLQVHRCLWMSLKVLQLENGSFSRCKTNFRIRFVLPADTLRFECPSWCDGNGGGQLWALKAVLMAPAQCHCFKVF